jgi:hypothetical protein
VDAWFARYDNRMKDVVVDESPGISRDLSRWLRFTTDGRRLAASRLTIDRRQAISDWLATGRLSTISEKHTHAPRSRSHLSITRRRIAG